MEPGIIHSTPKFCISRSSATEIVTTSSAYTPKQKALFVWTHITEMATIESTDVETGVKDTGIYTCQPAPRHYRSILDHIGGILRNRGPLTWLLCKTIENYSRRRYGCPEIMFPLSNTLSHVATVKIMSGTWMKAVRIETAQHKFRQFAKYALRGKNFQITPISMVYTNKN